jgi:methyltransferase (TIGR00027 family)
MTDRPSGTAIDTGRLRAAHQLIDQGCIFPDPHAVQIMGETEAHIRAWASANPVREYYRYHVAIRSHIAESRLAQAVTAGIRQAVILGAGLDTFSLRNPHADIGLRVYELDRPATQALKLDLIKAAQLPIPASTRFASVDLGKQPLRNALSEADVELSQAIFFVWLGVVTYLTDTDIFDTLSAIASIRGSEVVFDYGNPPEDYPPARRAALEMRIKEMAERGEKWQGFFRPASLQERLLGLGFSQSDNLSPHDITKRFRPELTPPPVDDPGSHIMWARA